MPKHGGNRTYDLYKASPILCLLIELRGHVGSTRWYFETDSSSFVINVILNVSLRPGANTKTDFSKLTLLLYFALQSVVFINKYIPSALSSNQCSFQAYHTALILCPKSSSPHSLCSKAFCSTGEHLLEQTLLKLTLTFFTRHDKCLHKETCH